MTRRLTYDYLNVVYEFDCTVSGSNSEYVFHFSPLNSYSRSQLSGISYVQLQRDNQWKMEAFRNPRFGLRTLEELRIAFEDVLSHS